MQISHWGCWTVRSLRVAALTAGLAWGTSSAWAQSSGLPAASQGAATKKTFTKNTTFNLPIQMDERTRSSLREVQLYVKSGASDWVRQEVVGPQTPFFTYKVPQDGEYWFALVTVDRAGKAEPSDINAKPPALRVVVDTRGPVLETALAIDGNEPVLRVNVIDANPDLQSIRAVVLTEQGDRALAPLPGQPNCFRLSSVDLNLTLRVTAADLSGNITSKDIAGRELVPPNGLVRNDGASSVLPVSSPSPALTPPPGLPGALPQGSFAPPTFSPPPSFNPAPPPGNINSTVYRPAMDTSDRPANRKIINTTHASIDYRIDTVGPSGIGRVDIYLTPDKGQNWTKVAEDTDKRTPAEIDLPGEGLFGIRLAITNGNGFGGRAPKAGDRPSFFIEVDATSPFVQLQPIDMVAGSGAIDIRWTASDNNMAAEPVTISYRTRADASWQPVVRNIKNDGVYRWAFPRDIGPQFFLKLEVVDQAGNVTKVETPTPILLDQTEPEATLVDVTGVQNRGASPSAPPMLAPGRN
jgi:hypothetical protein